MSNILKLPIDNQAEIISYLNLEQLMKHVNIFPMLKTDDFLWKKVLYLTKVEIYEEEITEFMPYYEIYLEHLISQKYSQTVELIVERDIFEGEISLIFKFRINTTPYDSNITFTYYEPEFCDSKSWENFISSANNEKNNILTFGRSNGLVDIETKNGDILFSVEKYGDVGSGASMLKIPFKYCRDAFDLALKEIKLCEDMKKNYTI